ncbi:PREDICTED: cytochrome P450 4g1-like, partial [Wasmannia auropunctata]|uniref:cytochrome P450 4g1-like n=1 Tax=Wasmannia auropunctata TaxID=64793 RepID=UPI0005ED5C1C
MDADPVTSTSYLSIATFSLLATLVTALIAAYYYVETSRTIRMIKKIPNPPSVPILGHTLLALGEVPENILQKALDYFNMCGHVVSAYLGSKALVFLTEPEDIEIILSSSVHIDKAEEYKFFDIIHRRHYDLSLRYDAFFKFTKLAKYQKKLLNIIHTLTEHVIKEKAKDVEDKHTKGQQLKEEQNGKLMENLNATENTENAKDSSASRMHYVRDDLDDIDENDIGEKKRLAFLEMMFEMKKNGQWTDEEIWEEVNTIMFEGHDTTAAGSSFALCVLGNHPDIQARVHEELDGIFGDSDRQCTYQDTLEMKYLERVIME